MENDHRFGFVTAWAFVRDQDAARLGAAARQPHADAASWTVQQRCQAVLCIAVRRYSHRHRLVHRWISLPRVVIDAIHFGLRRCSAIVAPRRLTSCYRWRPGTQLQEAACACAAPNASTLCAYARPPSGKHERLPLHSFDRHPVPLSPPEPARLAKEMQAQPQQTSTGRVFPGHESP